VACGSSGGSKSTPAVTTAPAAFATTTPKTFTAAGLRALDYATPLLRTGAPIAFLARTWKVKDSVFDDTGYTLRKQCGQKLPREIGATAGKGVQIVSTDNLVSLTTTADGFTDAATAQAAFDLAARAAAACVAWTNGPDHLVVTNSPVLPKRGDEAFFLTSRKVDTGLVVGDYMVRRGPFVFDLRYVIDGTASLAHDLAALGHVAGAASAPFLMWAAVKLQH